MSAGFFQSRPFLSRFLRGFRSPLEGFQFIQKNKFIWAYLTAPMGLTLVFSISFFVLMLNELPRMMAWLGITHLWPALYGLIWFAMIVGFLILSGTIGIFVSRALTFPLYAVLARKILKHQGSLSSSDGDISALALMAHSTGKTIFFLLLAAALFLCAFLPGLDIIMGFFASLLLALDCLDIPLELLQPRLQHRIGQWKLMAPEILGITCALALSLVIPGLSFVVIPSTIVGNCLLLSGTARWRSRCFTNPFIKRLLIRATKWKRG